MCVYVYVYISDSEKCLKRLEILFSGVFLYLLHIKFLLSNEPLPKFYPLTGTSVASGDILFLPSYRLF